MLDKDLKAKKLNNDEFIELQKTIQNISIETNAHDKNIYKKNHWNWQYIDLPSKESLIYVLLLKEKIIGYYHIPTYEIIINCKTIKIYIIITTSIHSF